MVSWSSHIEHRNRPSSSLPVESLRVAFEWFNNVLLKRESFRHYPGDCAISIISDVCEAPSHFTPLVNMVGGDFFAGGGIIIVTSLANVWKSGDYCILNELFLHFWDLLVMQNGWSAIEVAKFDTLFNSGCGGVLALVPSSYDLRIIRGLCVDSLSDPSTIYSLFLDTYSLFSWFIKNRRWAFGREFYFPENTRLFDMYLDYQINLLKVLVDRRFGAYDVLSVIIELNEFGVYLSSSVLHKIQGGVIFSCMDGVELYRAVLRSSLAFQTSSNYLPNISDLF